MYGIAMFVCLGFIVWSLQAVLALVFRVLGVLIIRRTFVYHRDHFEPEQEYPALQLPFALLGVIATTLHLLAGWQIMLGFDYGWFFLIFTALMCGGFGFKLVANQLYLRNQLIFDREIASPISEAKGWASQMQTVEKFMDQAIRFMKVSMAASVSLRYPHTIGTDAPNFAMDTRVGKIKFTRWFSWNVRPQDDVGNLVGKIFSVKVKIEDLNRYRANHVPSPSVTDTLEQKQLNVVNELKGLDQDALTKQIFERVHRWLKLTIDTVSTIIYMMARFWIAAIIIGSLMYQ